MLRTDGVMERQEQVAGKESVVDRGVREVVSVASIVREAPGEPKVRDTRGAMGRRDVIVASGHITSVGGRPVNPFSVMVAPQTSTTYNGGEDWDEDDLVERNAKEAGEITSTPVDLEMDDSEEMLDFLRDIDLSSDVSLGGVVVGGQESGGVVVEKEKIPGSYVRTRGMGVGSEQRIVRYAMRGIRYAANMRAS